MRLAATWLTGLTLIAMSTIGARADVRVVASIKPVHSLVAGVMDGVGTPELLVGGAASPHTYALKPSQARALQKADVIFWMGGDLETFLAKPLATLGAKARGVSLLKTPSLKTLGLREGGGFEAHEHDDADHKSEAKHDDHGHGKAAHAAHSDEHDHGEKASKRAGHDDHGHSETDVHVWLDPTNAIVLVEQIRATLAEADAANADRYAANAKAMVESLENLMSEVAAQLRPVRGRAFVVFHDAYQYFEKRFGVTATGSVTVSPEVMPGAKRIRELRAKVKSLDVACVFSEPQFQPKLVTTVVEGSNAKTAVLDPLGAAIDNGPDLYFTLIRNMGNSLRTCLSKGS